VGTRRDSRKGHVDLGRTLIDDVRRIAVDQNRVAGIVEGSVENQIGILESGAVGIGGAVLSLDESERGS